jgi:hypothetical protein
MGKHKPLDDDSTAEAYEVWRRNLTGFDAPHIIFATQYLLVSTLLSFAPRELPRSNRTMPGIVTVPARLVEHLCARAASV